MIGKITIDTERCKGCGLCVVVCPKNCLAISKHSNKNGFFPPQAKYTGCNGCAMCAVICPDATIQVQRDNNIVAIESKKKNKHGLTKEKV